MSDSMTEQDKFRIVGNLIELLELRRQECAKLRKECDALAKYADSRDALVERFRKELDAQKAATERLTADNQQYYKAWNEAGVECAKLRNAFEAYRKGSELSLKNAVAKRDHEARVAEQRGKALDLALSDLDAALGRARRLEAAIREHESRIKAKFGPHFYVAENTELWEVLDG